MSPSSNTTTMDRAVLILVGIGLLFFGLWAVLAPTSFTQTMNLSFRSPESRIDFYAMNGGLKIGVALSLLYGAMQSATSPFLLQARLTTSSFFLGRLIGCSLENLHQGPAIASLVLEASACALTNGYSIWRVKRLAPQLP